MDVLGEIPWGKRITEAVFLEKTKKSHASAEKFKDPHKGQWLPNFFFFSIDFDLINLILKPQV